MKTKVRLTKEQKAALAAYEYAERQEDRLAGSVFANAHNMRLQEAKTQEAYQRCKDLGMDHTHGL